MRYFIFRNNTIEAFFAGSDYVFSGYDDISYIPQEAENYIWFYQVPFKFDSDTLATEIDSFAEKLRFVHSQLPKEKNLLVFTLVDLFSVSYSLGDTRLTSAINRYNDVVYELAEGCFNVKVIHFESFTKDYAAKDLVDWKFYFISQMALNMRLAGAFRKWFNRQLESIAQKRKKCLVLDLDNTLWGGVLGEDGIDGIKIGGDYPGKAFLYFQEALAELSRQGIILTVCSKNNEQDVLDAWEKNPFIVLKSNYISAYRINWQNKADNIQELAAELNIGLDSMVFVDDNPTERELVKQMLPMVETPAFPTQPYELMSFFQLLVKNYFQVYSITDEDKKKTEQYKANANRAKAASQFTDFSQFLESLNIEITIESANDFNIPRIAQMTQKTNQFNLTTHRYTDTDIKKFLLEGWRIWCISVKDKFGDNGITGCIMIDGNRIDTLLLSCRILGKGIEFAFIKTVLALLKEQGVDMVTAEYIPTAKNAQVADFYDRCNFEPLNNGKYQLTLSNANLEIESYYHININ